jgi:hypothetical protein
MRLALKVVPKASRTRIAGWVGESLKVQVSAPPERGRANEAVLDLLASVLDLPRKALRIVVGDSSPRKVVEIDASEDRVRESLPRR